MSRHIRRGTTKATIEHAIDSLVPGAAEQLEGKAKVAIGKGEPKEGNSHER